MSLRKIGTGEGAQVFGWGIYSAENRETGESYRKNLGFSPSLQAGRMNADGTLNRVNTTARYILAGWSDENLKHELHRLELFWDEAKITKTIAEGHRLLDEISKEIGQLYRLEISRIRRTAGLGQTAWRTAGKGQDDTRKEIRREHHRR
jgi:hypothetical protein